MSTYIFHFYIELELEVHFYIELEVEVHFYIELELDVLLPCTEFMCIFHFYIELELDVHFYIALELEAHFNIKHLPYLCSLRSSRKYLRVKYFNCRVRQHNKTKLW